MVDLVLMYFLIQNKPNKSKTLEKTFTPRKLYSDKLENSSSPEIHVPIRVK